MRGCALNPPKPLLSGSAKPLLRPKVPLPGPGETDEMAVVENAPLVTAAGAGNGLKPGFGPAGDEELPPPKPTLADDAWARPNGFGAGEPNGL